MERVPVVFLFIRRGDENFGFRCVEWTPTVFGEINMTKKETEKKSKYTYWFAVVDKNNKIQNVIADTWYLINSRERMIMAQNDLYKNMQGNYRALVNYQLLGRKKEKSK